MHPYIYNKYCSIVAFEAEGLGGGGGGSEGGGESLTPEQIEALVAERAEARATELAATKAEELVAAKAEELAAAKAQELAKELAKQLVENETTGLKNKNQELLDKLKKATTQADKIKDLTDDDLKQLFEVRDRLKKDELTRLVAEGKTDEVVERLTKNMRTEYEAKIAEFNEQIETKSKEATEAKAAIENLLVANEVAKASGAVKQQYQPLIQGIVEKQIKVVDGNVRVVNEKGEVRFNTAGGPMTVSELIETLRPTYADLFQTSAGGGATGGSKNRTASKISAEEAAALPFEEYVKLRSQGKIA